ncbi:recombinase family protein [Paenarthrobacter sp. YJN-D]|uniref:recombinase family protein n=1 Tax=Paenarthrobacter sp. YJN-D TaxID=2735317 RepID=UPI001877B6BA|nr:recombinase family protein [Paenarthrobacter sp. YJN-D]QOT24075.1 recombinase family protein [Paenarthrobacter sp. YJN-D]
MTANLIGYARVSTAEQNPELQHDALERAGVIKAFTDYASGSTQDRPAWQQCLEFLQPGNVLVVWKLDRVGRSTADLARIVTELGERGVQFKSLTESFIDTTTADGRLIFHIFAALSEHERSRMLERTRAGLDAARARGRVGGRPSTMTEAKIKAARTMHAEKTPIVEIAQALGVGRMSVSRVLAKDQASRSV